MSSFLLNKIISKENLIQNIQRGQTDLDTQQKKQQLDFVSVRLGQE